MLLLILWKKSLVQSFVAFWSDSTKCNAIHDKEQTKHANCGLHGNFWSFLLMSFCFMMKKDHFKQKLLLWPQVPFKGNNLCWSPVPIPNCDLICSHLSYFFTTQNSEKYFPASPNYENIIFMTLVEGTKLNEICL